MLSQLHLLILASLSSIITPETTLKELLKHKENYRNRCVACLDPAFEAFHKKHENDDLKLSIPTFLKMFPCSEGMNITIGCNDPCIRMELIGYHSSSSNGASGSMWGCSSDIFAEKDQISGSSNPTKVNGPSLAHEYTENVTMTFTYYTDENPYYQELKKNRNYLRKDTHFLSEEEPENIDEKSDEMELEMADKKFLEDGTPPVNYDKSVTDSSKKTRNSTNVVIDTALKRETIESTESAKFEKATQNPNLAARFRTSLEGKFENSGIVCGVAGMLILFLMGLLMTSFIVLIRRRKGLKICCSKQTREDEVKISVIEVSRNAQYQNSIETVV